MKPVSDICGIVLAAGESSRMGSPKALLELQSGVSLLEHQVCVLADAGCSSIACVLGAEADLIMGMHASLNVDWLLNEDWPKGQFTSIQLGLAWMLDRDGGGALIQPVDVVLESPDTANSILQTAMINSHLGALVPEYGGRGGHPVFISSRAAKALVQIDPEREDARLDRQIVIMQDVLRLPVNDKGILLNINTPEEWERAQG